MLNKNEFLYTAAVSSIKALFNDKSVSKERCADQLKALKDEIDIYIESLGLE